MHWSSDNNPDERGNGGHKPPDTEAVVRRSMCLAALVRRAEIEEGLAAGKDEFSHRAAKAFIGLAGDIDRWLEREGLTPYLSGGEREVFGIAAGKWPRQRIIDANWRVEALAVLLWALSQLDRLPKWDEMVDNVEILNRSGLFEPVLDFIMSARLRPHEQLHVRREMAGIWRWRSHTGMLIREGKLKRGEVDINEVIGQAARELYVNHNAVLPVEGDIVAFGKPFRDLDEEEFNVVSSISLERSTALNWLCGIIKDWDGG